jgi:hydroxymethylbilane synthase
MTLTMNLRIATRQSPLALKQAELVKSALEKFHPHLKISLVPLTTQGDKLLDQHLASLGGKGLFIKELEHALLEEKADIAVHSMKDMPVQLTPDLEMSAFMERDDPRDVLVSIQYKKLIDIPLHHKIGTASLRRQGMIKYHRSDLITETLRGNVNTRLSKLDDGNYSGIILAAAGLHRLGFQNRIQHYFSPEESLPAVGQGIIGIQCRKNDKKIRKLLLPLDHYPSRLCCVIERLFNQALEGNCHSPIGGYATLQSNKIHLRGCVYSIEQSLCLKSENHFVYQPTSLEKEIRITVQKLLDQGAAELLQSSK